MAIGLWMICGLIYLSACAGNQKEVQMSREDLWTTETSVTAQSDASFSLADLPINSNSSEMFKVEINGAIFNASFVDNPTANAFRRILPVSLLMTELNGNEKYGTLTDVIPNDHRPVDSIKNGDIMLFGDNTLVLFYKSFQTGYHYTKIGSIDDPSRLAEIAGHEQVLIRFSLLDD
ncbi:cyclophilin-like fold protein [Enterococcus sp. DIV0876]|uniref:cyclophilin-like fold protein n=1 Tax=Enterococcus sp. DIV0876 TaxID=2774633 RepID=UPI003D2FD1E7